MVGKKSIVYFLFFIPLWAVCAQNIGIGNELTITEDLAVTMARSYNIPLKISEIEVAVLQRANDTSWNTALPSLSVSASLGRNGSAALPSAPQRVQTEAEKWSLTASAGASFALSSSSFTSIQTLRRDYESGLVSYDNAVKKLEISVKKTFYQLLVIAEDVRLSGSVYANAERKYNRDKQDYERGLVSEMQVLRSQVLFENAKSDIMLKQFNYQKVLDDFCAMLGIERGAAIQLDGQIDPLIRGFDAEELIAKHLYSRADIIQANFELERLEAEKRTLLLNAYTPSLNASYALSYGNILALPLGSQLTDAAVVSLSLKIPLDMLIPGTKENNKLLERSAAIEKQHLKIEQTITDAMNEIFSLIKQLEKSSQALDFLRSAQNLADRSYNITSQAYQRGEIPYTDVIDSEYNLEVARQRVLTERYNYRSLKLDLEYALNTGL